ncbi:MAG: NAD(P)H-flavin reductase [Tolumonas sp.]|jgi:aquacobalamin reductase/NAD(P)H-flavin reductase|nr:NAD(P)H-flavin reductase [Tolumonas sp.]TXH64319.1 MAG: NAD(P)H-flavin reductase [Tolumonas sp.]
MPRTVCHLETLHECAEHIWHVRLIPEQPIAYKPGQYLQVIMGEKDKRSFSIASSPSRGNALELQIGATPGNPYPGQVLEALRTHGKIEVEMPLGNAYLREHSERPILLIAGGTGYSYARSILQYLVDHQMPRQVYLYWGVRKADQLYEGEEVLNWSSEFKDLTFVPVVQFPDDDWQGRSGLVHEAVLSDFHSFSQFDIYVAGRFEMAAVIRDALRHRDVKEDQLFGDAFSFS